LIAKIALVGATAVALIASAAPAARAWGLQGHTMIGQAAMAHLPDELPPFMHTDAAKAEIVYLQDEEDRLKLGNSEQAWAREWTTDHYLDVDDNGMVGGAVALSDLPPTRDRFEAALCRAHPSVDAYDVGFLPYAMLEGYEQVRTDFALWRFASADAAHATGAQGLTAQEEVAERARLTIHDIGIFAHFVGDGSQPLHVSVHFNGWGAYPNPQGFTESRDTHAAFESDFVDRYLSASDVTPLVGPARELSAEPLPDIEQYLETTVSQVVPFYEMEKAGAFAIGDSTSDEHRKGVAFTAQRLAAASQMLDSLILTAWRSSAQLKEEY
jgi:hypothetical protein